MSPPAPWCGKLGHILTDRTVSFLFMNLLADGLLLSLNFRKLCCPRIFTVFTFHHVVQSIKSRLSALPYLAFKQDRFLEKLCDLKMIFPDHDVWAATENQVLPKQKYEKMYVNGKTWAVAVEV